MTEEERKAATEEFFAKKRRQNAGEEAVPGAEEIGSVAAAGVKGAIEGAATGALKGAGKAIKAGVGALVVDPALDVAKLAGTGARLLGWDGLHRMAADAEQGWANWGSDALDHGYEDALTQIGDFGAKVTGIAGMVGSFAGPGALAKAGGALGKIGKVYREALPYIFGNSAAVETYDKAKANGQSETRAWTEAAADGAIHFMGFKLYANKTLNKMLRIPEVQGPRTDRLIEKGAEQGVKGFSSLVKAVRNGSLSEILVERGKGALKAGGIMGLQNMASAVAEQYADEDVRPVEAWSDEEIAAGRAKINAWEAEQKAAEAEGRRPDIALKPEWEKDWKDRLQMAMRAGLQGVWEGALMEGVMGAGEAGLTIKEAREATSGAIMALTRSQKGRAFINRQNPDAMAVVADVARRGGRASAEQLDEAGLPPEMDPRDVRRLAFDLRRDEEDFERAKARSAEDYRKRAELAERVIAEQEDGKPLEFDSEEKKAEVELALHEHQERIDEAVADDAVDAAQGMADTLFGKEAGVLVRRGTAEEQERGIKAALGEDADAKALKDAAGTVTGWWNRKTGEVVLFRGADEMTVAHELGWHATRTWAERNAPELLAKMNEYARSCPEKLRREIEKAYPDFDGDALLDEIGAARFEREMGERFGEMLERSPEANSWWQGLKDLIAEAWRGMVKGLKGEKVKGLKGIDLKALEGMEPEEGMEWLAGKMLEGKKLEGERGFDFTQGGKIRPQIAGEVEARNAARRENMTAEERAATPPWETEDTPSDRQIIRYSRKLKPEERPEGKTVGEKITALVNGSLKRNNGAITYRESETDARRLATEAKKVYEKYAKREYKLPTGGVLYFQPDERTVEAYGGDEAAAWGEYALHLITHTRGSGEGRYRSFDGRSIDVVLPNIEAIIKADKVKAQDGRIIFYKQTKKAESKTKSRYAYLVTEPDADGNLRVDLRYITGMQDRGFLPGDTATLKEVISDRTAEGHALHRDQTGADYSTGGGAAQEGIRPQIRGIYTGSAADYANRSREGGVDDGPSVKKIGSGEGATVYGWGLYGSSKRGVAEEYAKAGKEDQRTEVRYKGKLVDENAESDLISIASAIRYVADHPKEAADVEDYYGKMIATYEDRGELYRPYAEAAKKQLEMYKTDPGAWKAEKQAEQLYEQTFFTNRAEGDESHLLKWYEPVSEEIQDRLGDAAVNEGLMERDGKFVLFGDYAVFGPGIKDTGEKLYETFTNILGTQKAASEWLYAHGIDGVKYPVDSYGKTVKDGEKAGWNYVAFSDEHIRVDHKWTDGQIRYSRKLIGTDKGVYTARIDTKNPKTKDGFNTVIFRRSPVETAEEVRKAPTIKMVQAALPKDVKLGDKEMKYTPEEKSRVRRFVKDAAKSQRGDVENLDFGKIHIGRDFVNEVQQHALSTAREIAAVSSAREIASQMKHFAAAPNEEIKKGKNKYIEYGLAKFEFEGATYLVMGEVGVRNNATPYYDQRVVAKLKAAPSPSLHAQMETESASIKADASSLILHDGMKTESAFDAVYDNRFRILMQAVEESRGANEANTDIRPQRRLTVAEERERTERALKAVREGRVRVADNGAAAGERSEAGQATSEELLRAQSAPCEDRSVSNPVSFSMSQMIGLLRALTSNPALPRVLQEAKRKGAAWVSRLTKDGIELNPEAFGIIDATDREAVKTEMIAEGMFRNEDPVWNMKHSKAQCEEERKLSEARLEDGLHTLAEDRIRGKAPGGDRVATNALAHEIGQLVMAMPMSESLRTAAGKEGAKTLKDLRTVGEGLVKTLESEWTAALKEGVKDRGGAEWDAELDAAGHLRDAVEAVAWWRGIGMTAEEMARYGEAAKDGTLPAEEIARLNGEMEARLAEEGRAKAALAKDQKELAGELFGMFLAAPEALRERAPRAFNRIVEALSDNETLLKAYSRIASADAPTEVMAKIEERQTVEAMSETRRLKKDLQSALGTRWERMKLAVARGIWSRESPALMRIKWKATEEIALAKEALKLAKKGRDKEEIRQAERNLELAKRSAKEAVEAFRHEIIMKHRNGGAGLNYMNQLDSRVLGTLARGGLEVKDLDRYMKCRNVIANQGKAMDFGITPQEANRALEAQRSDLGEEKWAVLERAAKEFHENRERNILDDENVKEMIGAKRIARWKLNSSYVRNERTLTAEEVAELNDAQYEPLTERTKARFRKQKETKNWELLTDPANVARMKAVEIDIESAAMGGSAERLENRSLRAKLKEIFAGFGLCKNAETGSEVEFPGSSAGKLLSQGGADFSKMAPHLKALFEGATAAWYEPETRMEGHTFHPNVKGYRNYINRFSTKDGTEWYIRFTVRENKGEHGRNDVHAATVSDVRLYKNTGATILVNKTSRSSGAESMIPANNTGRRLGAFVDRKISHFLSGVKTDRAVDVVKEMDALIKLHQTRGVMGGERFLKPLVGSFRPTEAPTEATAMHDMSLLEYARQNHYVAALAEYATKMKLEGFAVVRDMRYKGVNAGDRYGTRAFMKDGENFLLIMPKDVERGFASDPEAMQFLVELNRGMAKMLTTFSARFAVRNVARNREANENNIEWMAPSRLKDVMGAVGFRPEARGLELAIERAVVRLPDWVIRNPVARLVWNPKTNMFHMAEANRLARLLFVPGELKRVSEEADAKVRDALEKGGDVEAAAAEAKSMLAECDKARRIAKMPIFAGNYLRQLGYGGKDDVTGLMDRLEGRKGGGDGWVDRLPFLGKIWKGAEWWMGKVQDFNTLEEARTKIAALLSAEWQRSAAAAKGRAWKYGDDRRIADIIAVNSGSPMGELRGTWWNAMETMVSGVFGNVSMKGAVRTIESAKRSPLEWSLKAVRRAQNYAARRILWGGGGMLVLIAAARRMFGDNEEAQKALDVLERWAKKMTRAFSMITDYRLKTYDIIPLALLGNDVVLGNCLPRGDEDKLLTPAVDWAVDAALGTKAAKDDGFAEPLGGRYGLGDLAGATFQNSGLIPDIERGGISFKVMKDTFGAMFFSNPYNAFTGRPTYDETLYEQRGERKWEFTKEMLKQAWNDLGGQSILPLAQGPEDTEDVTDGMTTVWSATGDETTVGGGKTIFRLLHELPIGGAILSGFLFMNTKGQERVTKRLLKMEEKRKATLNHVAMQCVDRMASDHSTGADVDPIFDEARVKYGLEPDEEEAIINAIVKKLKKLAIMEGKETTPIRDLMNKEIIHPSRYERMRRELINTGWEIE